MKSLRFLERGESRKAMKVTKVRKKSSYPMGTAKCMRVRRTSSIHSWGSISGYVDDCISWKLSSSPLSAIRIYSKLGYLVDG